MHRAEGRSLPQRVCNLSMPTNRQSTGVCWKQAVALRDIALRKKRDKVEQSVAGGFSMPGGLPPLCFMDPEKKKKGRRDWGCCLCPKPCRCSGWKQMCPSVQTLHVPASVAGERGPHSPPGPALPAQSSWLGRCLGMAAPALSLFFSTECGGQAQKCHLAAVASSLLLHVPPLCILCKETITKRRKKS